MPTNDKFNLDGFKVDENDVCTADGGFVTSGTGSVNGISINDSSIYESASDELVVSADGSVTLSTASVIELYSDAGILMIPNLPTSDPVSAGQIWSNSGVLTVSAGA